MPGDDSLCQWNEPDHPLRPGQRAAVGGCEWGRDPGEELRTVWGDAVILNEEADSIGDRCLR